MQASPVRNWGAALLVLLTFCFTANLFGQATLISPAPGSVLAGPSVTFTWAAASGATAYDLWLGFNGPGSSSLYTSGWTTATSSTVTSLPTKGATVYARLYSMVGGKVQYNDYTFLEATSSPATLISPAAGSVLGASNQVFTWSAGIDVAEYQLWLGSSGPGSSSLYTSGWLTTTSSIVPSLPTKGATVYARLFSWGSGGMQYNDYVFNETGVASLGSLSCSNSSITGAATDACTVALNGAAPAGGLMVSLSSSNPAASVPSGVMVPANATSAGFMATVSAVTSSQPAMLTANSGGAAQSFSLMLNSNVPTLSVAVTGVPVAYGSAVTMTATVSNGPTGLITFSDGGNPIGTGTINGTTATFTTSSLTAGTHSITAAWGGNGMYCAAASGAATQVVTKATPAVNWNAPAAVRYGTALSSAQLAATSAVAGSFAYSPAAGTVLDAGAQTLTVTFTPTDTVDYNNATASVSLTVNKATSTITWAAPAAVAYGAALNGSELNATASVAGSFAYSPAAGTVLAAGVQTLSVSFTPANTTDYSAATASVALTVNAATPVITWAAPGAIAYGTALSASQLDAAASVAGTFAYSPAAGTVLSSGAQVLSVTFTPTDAVDYTTATAAVTLTVNSATPTITWAAPTSITYGMALGATQLNATASVPGTLVYTPALGTVLTSGSQTLSVTFTPTDTTDYNTATATTTLTVSKGTPTITWAAPSSIAYGTALGATQLNATASVPGTFAYTPAAGTVLTSGSQTLSVTFTPTDTTDYNTATATTTLTVSKGTPTVTWGAPSGIGFGTALSATQLDATASVPGTFAYTPAAGTVLTAGAQTLSVTFTPSDATDYNSATATVTLTVSKAAPTVTWGAPTAITYGTALGASQLNATANVPGTFSYAPAAGAVLTAGTQMLSVTFTPTDATNYNGATATVTLMVNKATSTITWATPAGIAYGTVLSAAQLNATASVPGTFMYTPAAGTVLASGSQTLSVTFTPTDATDYNSATATTTLTVNKATPSITWATPAGIAYGTALSAAQLNATASVPGTFAYTPAAGTVLTSGTQTLSVTFTPTDTTDYNTATATVALAVNKANSTVSWATPAGIVYGTALSAAQLNASSSVAGSFAYSPAAGTVLTAGSQTLSATFTPTDTTDYNTATATTTLTVNKATPAVIWATPSAIVAGTALSATQLDATANVAGSFAYSPASGTVLAAGTQTLTVTFTPTDGNDYSTATGTVTLTVNQAVPTLSINASSVAFGSVDLGQPATQTLTLSSTGNASVTVNSAAVSGTGFTLAGATLPVTLAPGQSTTVGVEFNPTVAGAATGTLTVNSTSTTNGTATIGLTGTGTAVSYQVNLSWNAPASSPDPVAGYNVYRAPSGSTMYQLVNASVETQTAYVDTTVQNGSAYDYIVESVDASGVTSAPTSPVLVTIP